MCELRMRVTCLSSANTTQGGYTSSTEKKKQSLKVYIKQQ